MLGGRETVSRLDPEKWRQETSAKCPHNVDLTPPVDGYSGVVEGGIMEFLESRIGSFDLFVYVDKESGEPVIRYCFEREADAEAFHALFGPAADKAVFKKAV
jgi:hypothetical protein